MQKKTAHEKVSTRYCGRVAAFEVRRTLGTAEHSGGRRGRRRVQVPLGDVVVRELRTRLVNQRLALLVQRAVTRLRKTVQRRAVRLDRRAAHGEPGRRRRRGARQPVLDVVVREVGTERPCDRRAAQKVPGVRSARGSRVALAHSLLTDYLCASMQKAERFVLLLLYTMVHCTIFPRYLTKLHDVQCTCIPVFPSLSSRRRRREPSSWRPPLFRHRRRLCASKDHPGLRRTTTCLLVPRRLLHRPRWTGNESISVQLLQHRRPPMGGGHTAPAASVPPAAAAAAVAAACTGVGVTATASGSG